jgi:excisionase family DNA binding protein
MNSKLRTPVETPWMTCSLAAAYAQCSEKTITRAVKRGGLQHVRLMGTRQLRFRREWVDRWLQDERPDSVSGADPSKQPLKPGLSH